jgi:hypothetical protein
MRTITRWQNGQKLEIQTESEAFGSARALEIISKARYSDFDAVMTDSEIAFVRDIWDQMPGNTSFSDALHRIAQRKAGPDKPTHTTAWERGNKVGEYRLWQYFDARHDRWIYNVTSDGSADGPKGSGGYYSPLAALKGKGLA